MKEIFYLNSKALPTIPVPHDCVIKEIQVNQQYLIFVFEDDISGHDAVKYINPGAKSLIIRCHLVDEDAFSVYKWNKPDPLFHKNGYYECLDNSQFIKSAKSSIEYLYHNVGFCSIIIKLFSDETILLDAEADYLEYEWIERLS
ncbi:MAG: hypothetical protein HDT16_04955 [Oscillibacter sp.]|nr:hypothetical protein [Oscillibacter sp.]